jgi:hypothetical protein
MVCMTTSSTVTPMLQPMLHLQCNIIFSMHLQRPCDVLARHPAVTLGIACGLCLVPELRAGLRQNIVWCAIAETCNFQEHMPSFEYHCTYAALCQHPISAQVRDG